MKPIFKYFGTDGRLKVTINVLVLRLPPESFGTVILFMSVTPWLCSSESICCLSQSTRSRQRMTPLQELRVLWGETETGHPPSLSNDRDNDSGLRKTPPEGYLLSGGV